jgi:hypothetical protein
MKKLFLVMAFFVFCGCAAGPTHIPDGKTVNDWAADREFCEMISGRYTGFLAATPNGIAANLGDANQKYEECLREKGWIK